VNEYAFLTRRSISSWVNGELKELMSAVRNLGLVWLSSVNCMDLFSSHRI
jgi:hypothetical protein